MSPSPAPPSARNLRVPPLHLPRKLPVVEARTKGRGECAWQLRRTVSSGRLFVFFTNVYELPGTSLHKELLCWCYTRLFIGACVAGCTWGLAPLCLLHFPVNCQFIALQRRGRGGSVWTDFLSPIKSGLLPGEEDLIFPQMQSAAFSASQF